MANIVHLGCIWCRKVADDEDWSLRRGMISMVSCSVLFLVWISTDLIVLLTLEGTSRWLVFRLIMSM